LYTLKDCNLREMAITKYGGVIHGVYVQYKYLGLLYVKYK